MKEVFDLGEHLSFTPDAQCPGACRWLGCAPGEGSSPRLFPNSGSSQGMSRWDLLGLLPWMGQRCREMQSLASQENRRESENGGWAWGCDAALPSAPWFLELGDARGSGWGGKPRHSSTASRHGQGGISATKRPTR